MIDIGILENWMNHWILKIVKDFKDIQYKSIWTKAILKILYVIFRVTLTVYFCLFIIVEFFHQNSTNFRILQPKFPRHPLVLKAAVQHRDLFFKTFVHRVVRVCPSNSSLRFPNYLGHTKDRKVALVESGRALTHSRVLVTTGFSFLL